jgi:ribose 5-phosphate isomerase B
MTEAVGSGRGPAVIFGADARNECVDAVVAHLRHVTELTLVDSTAWTEIGEVVGRAVASGEHRFGVVMCWTGTGTAMAANKVPGVRAALCWEPWIAERARRWNDANVLALSLKRTAPDVAVECLRAFLAVDEPDPDEAPAIDALRHR